ncbi:MAG: cation transporter, partial [Bythopirellula sp.]
MSKEISTPEAIEHRSLHVGKWGNLFMAVAGVVASFLSNSDALLVDGLYSGVNFVSAIIAAKIATTVALPPDRRYPFGYDAHEALYVTFRSLVLLGIMAVAALGAVGKIVAYASGQEIPKLQFGPILVYSVIMVVICLALAAWHRFNWQRSGKRSEILTTESRAAVVDAVISGGVGGGFLTAMILEGMALEFIVPVSDSIIVLVMCVVIAGQPVTMFLRALRQVAGASAEPATVDKVRQCLHEILRDQPFEPLDVAVTKMGRSYFVVSYVKPDASVDGEAADEL